MPTELEMALALQLQLLGLPEPQHQFRFHPTRRWRADLAYPDKMLLIECDGGVFGPALGRHTTGVGFTGDCEKCNEAVLLGYRVLRFTPPQIRSGEAAATVERALNGGVADGIDSTTD